jgi:DNA-binding transcriptional ArsR family regulator
LRKRNEESALATTTKTKKKTKSAGAIDQRLVKALAHPLRVQILMILNERMASPNELSKELEEGLSQVSYHVKVLKDFECIEMVKTEPRRGAVEHYYRATERAYLADRDWEHLPDSIKPGVTASVFESIIQDVVGAIEGGTFNARDDVHMSWTPGVVDEQGWGESADLLNETLAKLIDIQASSAKRLAKSGEEGIPATAVLMNFEGLSAEAKSAKKGSKRGRAKKAVK